MDRTYLRGEMYYADLGKGVGSEQEGRRPVVIIQNDAGNKFSPTVIVAAITTRVTGKKHLPAHYYIGADNGLREPSVALLEQIRTIDKRRLREHMGHVDAQMMNQIDAAIAVSFGLHV